MSVLSGTAASVRLKPLASRRKHLGCVMLSKGARSLKERLPLALLLVELLFVVSCLGILYYGFLTLMD
jgi:hypothetical protein